jgi:hypothetical protein
MGTTTTNVYAKDFKRGDRLASGSTILGYLRLAKGGIAYMVETPGGARRELVFDGRRKYAIVIETD